MTTQTSAPVRRILIKSSQGKDNHTIEFSGTTKKELVQVLLKEGYNANSMKIIESVNRTTLEHDTALVPLVDHRIHLYPHKTKGGAKKAKKVIRTRTELYAIVKSAFATDEKAADKMFNSGKNFTRKNSEELDELATKWIKKHGAPSDVKEAPVESTETIAKPAKKSRTKATVISEVVGGLAENAKAQEEPKDVVQELPQYEQPATPEAVIETAVGLLKTITGHENQVLIEEAITKLGKALIKKPTLTEAEIAQKEHDELFDGLQGVSRY